MNHSVHLLDFITRVLLEVAIDNMKKVEHIFDSLLGHTLSTDLIRARDHLSLQIAILVVEKCWAMAISEIFNTFGGDCTDELSIRILHSKLIEYFIKNFALGNIVLIEMNNNRDILRCICHVFIPLLLINLIN